jgi:hypothetical protein
VAWLLVAIQIVLAVTYALPVASVIAACWRSQVLIISAALSGKQRIEMAGFYLFLGVMLAIGFAAVRFIRP